MIIDLWTKILNPFSAHQGWKVVQRAFQSANLRVARPFCARVFVLGRATFFYPRLNCRWYERRYMCSVIHARKSLAKLAIATPRRCKKCGLGHFAFSAPPAGSKFDYLLFLYTRLPLATETACCAVFTLLLPLKEGGLGRTRARKINWQLLLVLFVLWHGVSANEFLTGN